MRLTRAAQRAQTGGEEIAHAKDATETIARTPLDEIFPNASPELVSDPQDLSNTSPVKGSKSKAGAKKGKKGNKAKAEEEVQFALEGQRIPAGSPVSDVAAEDLANERPQDASQAPVSDERPATPPSKAVRSTRRHLAKHEEEETKPQYDDDGNAETFETHDAPQDIPSVVEERVLPDIQSSKSERVESEIQTEKAESEVVTPSEDMTLGIEPKMLAFEKPQEGTATRVKSRTPNRRIPRSPSKSPMRIEESIGALDALEDALENVKAVTNLQHSIKQSPLKKATQDEAQPGTARSKTPKKAHIPAAKISRTPNAAPRSMKSKPTEISRPGIRPEARKVSETADYLVSKRRPISVSFPTPPPPPKGKAPTKAAFQLSSTAVAEKLKQDKEERLKRQAEGTIPKQRPISRTLPAKSTKPLTKASFELPGEKIAAELKAKREERLKSAGEAQKAPRPISMPPAPKSTKPLTKASFELPSSAMAAKLKQQREERLKRQEAAEAARKAAITATKPVPVRKPIPRPARPVSGVPLAPSASSSQHTSIANKRNSIQLSRSTSASSPSRNSVILSKGSVSSLDAAAQKVKGREVFNRDKVEKEARERERRDKEDAAKKARAEAAERGRIASREWAERQRKKVAVAGEGVE